MKESWDLGFNIIQRMYFDSALMLTKLCPLEYFKT